MPLDGPMWKMYMQDYIVNDKPGGVMIFKCHHSFGDGASTMSMQLAMSSDYDRSYFIPSKDVPYINRIITRLMFPFMLPLLAFHTLKIWKDNNFISK